ncbi:hypothetical protein JCM21900_002464 [Sporobolomyces salmonicolor]
MTLPVSEPTTIGVLALQGSFAEHLYALSALPASYNLRPVPVRTAADLAPCRGLIIPGGESTAISLLIRKSGLYEPLKEFVRDAKEGRGKSIWGTCAGMILLAREIDGPVSEGWDGLDGMDVRVGRNSYGRQLQSFAHPLSLSFLPATDEPLLATFIRAPLVHSLLPSTSSSPVEVIARIPAELVPSPPRAKGSTGGTTTQGPDADAVMLRQGGLVASSWHPELNKQDQRVHDWWVREVVFDGARQR